MAQRTVLAASLVYDPQAGVSEAYDGELFIQLTYSQSVPNRRRIQRIIQASSRMAESFYGYCFHAGPPRMAWYFKDPSGPILLHAALRAEFPSSVPLPDGPIARAAVECSHEPPPIRVEHTTKAVADTRRIPRGTPMTTRSNSKGFAVLEAFAASDSKEGITRAAAAEAAGCTVQRVGEILRDNEGLVTPVEGEAKGRYTILAPAWKAFNKEREQAAAAKEKEAAEKAAAAEAAKAAKQAERDAAKAAKEAAKETPAEG